uniref:RHS repeat domain-containing protein n=1 Tax=uncultured Microscilla sp. TaxID=432653 RepID=UPI00261211D3
DQEVFFDDMVVEHTPQLIVQENHYYPFGMNLRGIEKQGRPEHRYQYNGGIEKEMDFNLNFYTTTFRSYDPQLGRFHQIDPLVDAFASINPYQYAYNNPLYFNDPLGLAPMGDAPSNGNVDWEKAANDMSDLNWENRRKDRHERLKFSSDPGLEGKTKTTYTQNYIYQLEKDGSRTLIWTQEVKKVTYGPRLGSNQTLKKGSTETYTVKINASVKQGKLIANQAWEMRGKKTWRKTVGSGRTARFLEKIEPPVFTQTSPENVFNSNKNLYGYFKSLSSEIAKNPSWNPFSAPISLPDEAIGYLGAASFLYGVLELAKKVPPTNPWVLGTVGALGTGSFLANQFKKYYDHSGRQMLLQKPSTRVFIRDETKK